MRRWLVGSVMLLAGCARPPTPEPPRETIMNLQVSSPAFAPGEAIPARYTCQGEDVSPPLEWSPGPAGTVAYALIMDDPDAPRGTWTHWVAWNIRDTRLPEHAAGLTVGQNSWGRPGYGGPCPPAGRHRYYFRVYALSATLDLPPTTDAAALRQAVEPVTLAVGELLGTYAKN